MNYSVKHKPLSLSISTPISLHLYLLITQLEVSLYLFRSPIHSPRPLFDVILVI